MNWKRNLYILWISQVLSLMSFGFGLPLIPFYIQELGVHNEAAIKLFTGILNSAPSITMALMAPIWGKLSDKYGRKPMIIRAMASAAVIITLMGTVKSVNQLVFLRTIQGLFTGTTPAASAFVGANTPRQNLSYALGFLSSAFFLGSSIGQAVGGLAADAFGNRASFFIGGVIMAVGVVITAVLLKEDPSTYGEADTDDESAPKKSLRIKDLYGLVGLLLVMLMLQRFIRSFFDPFMPLYLEQLHGSYRIKSVAGYVRMAISIATALAGLTLTRLGDRMDKRKLIMGLTLITAALTAGMVFFQGFWPFVILFTIMSFFLGGIEPLLTSFSAEQVDSKNRGLLFGYQGTVTSIGWMIAPVVGSFLSIQYGNYEVLLLAMLVGLAVSMLLAYMARPNTR